MLEDVREFLDDLDPAQAAIVRRVLEVAGAAVPNMSLKFVPGWGTINLAAPKFFGVVGTTKQIVRVYLEWGTLLDDPHGLITRFGRRTAQIDIAHEEDINEPALADLCRQAAALAADRL